MTFLRFAAFFAFMFLSVTHSYAQGVTPPTSLTPAPIKPVAEAEGGAIAPAAPAGLATKAESEAALVEKLETGGGYIEASPRDLFQTYAAMGGMDFKNPDNVDYYASIFYCGLFKEKYSNDFEWNGAREQISTQLARQIPHHVLYEIPGIIFLQRYNFESQDFPLRPESALFNVGSMILARRNIYSGCELKNENLQSIAENMVGFYMIYLRQAFTFDRLKIPMDQAEKILERMTREKNKERKLYVRFRLKLQSYQESQKPLTAAFGGELTAVDIFFDQEMTQHLTSVPID